MQINAINSVNNNVNFEGRKNKKNEVLIPEVVQSNDVMSKSAARALRNTIAGLMAAGSLASCSDKIEINNTQIVDHDTYITLTIPRDTLICPHPHDPGRDTVIIIKPDTIRFRENNFPHEAMDSLSKKLHDLKIIDIPDNKFAVVMRGFDEWDQAAYDVNFNSDRSNKKIAGFDMDVNDIYDNRQTSDARMMITPNAAAKGTDFEKIISPWGVYTRETLSGLKSKELRYAPGWKNDANGKSIEKSYIDHPESKSLISGVKVYTADRPSRDPWIKE